MRDPGRRRAVRFPRTIQPSVIIYAYPAPASNDVRYPYTQDVPWDWAHRYPPAVVPSDRPYVSSCPTESVTVPGRDGDRTINIIRCY